MSPMSGIRGVASRTFRPGDPEPDCPVMDGEGDVWRYGDGWWRCDAAVGLKDHALHWDTLPRCYGPIVEYLEGGGSACSHVERSVPVSRARSEGAGATVTNRAPTPSQPGSNLEDPVALLREAARLLREHAAAVDSSNWHAEPRRGTDDEWQVSCYPPPEIGGDWGWYVATGLGVPAAKWIALVSPAIAGPLAILLDETANTCEVDRSEYGSNDRMLSAVARAIVKAAQR